MNDQEIIREALEHINATGSVSEFEETLKSKGYTDDEIEAMWNKQ